MSERSRTKVTAGTVCICRQKSKGIKIEKGEIHIKKLQAEESEGKQEEQQKISNPRFRDLAGEQFGRLLVLYPTDKRMDGGSVVWHCQCSCGNSADVSSRRLVRGKVRSCGCLSNPPLENLIGKTFGRLTVKECVGRERKTLTNSKITVTYWKCKCVCGNTVIVKQSELQSGDTKSCGCLQKDRAREALKLLDHTSAAIIERTCKGPRSSNKSGYTGVYYDKRTGKWMAYINFKKKRYWLGRYEAIEDAVKIRKEAEKRLFGEFLDWYYATAGQ